MSKRVAMTWMLAILTAVLVWTMTRENPSSERQTHGVANDSPAPSPFSHANAPANDSLRTVDSFDRDEALPARSESITTPYGRLRALERAALAGDAKAQFRLSRAMRHCTVVLAYSEDSVQAIADPLRRSHLLESRDECDYFADRRERLVDEAFDWERRATDAGDPGALALQIGTRVNNGELQAYEAREKLASLLAANDPFVFATIARLGMKAGLDAESAAWHMLACEREGPPDLCSIMNGAISQACTGDVRCGNTSHEVDIAHYYLHAHPNVFDLARGRYQELKDQLLHGRIEEIDLPLAAPSFDE